MAPDDVVVTGVGLVTPLGETAAGTAEAWRAGGRADRAAMPELAGTLLSGAAVARPHAFDAGARLGSRRMLKFMSPAAVLGCVAAREAAEMAGLKTRFDPARVGLYAGTGLAAASLDEALPAIRASLDEAGRISYRRMGERGLAAANPLLSFKILANMPPCLVSIQEGVKGPNLLFTPWEGQTAAGLCEAWRAVGEGSVDAALCGGADDPACPTTLACLFRAGRLRAGETAAAAAGYLVFERAERAARDGRRILARIPSMAIGSNGTAAFDPLADRMGRSYAAAPAVLLGLACLCGGGARAMTDEDGLLFSFEAEDGA